MIVEVGSDLCRIDRIERSLFRFGAPYLARLFTAREQANCGNGPNAVANYARCFAAKEACAKALGTGLADGVDWRGIEVLLTDHGDTLILINGAMERLRTIIPSGHRPVLHLTATGSRHIAQAFVVIEALALVEETAV